MVGVYQPRDIGGELGGMIGGGLGKGFGEGMGVLAQRNMQKRGIDNLQKTLKEKYWEDIADEETGEMKRQMKKDIDPMDLILDLTKGSIDTPGMPQSIMENVAPLLMKQMQSKAAVNTAYGDGTVKGTTEGTQEEEDLTDYGSTPKTFVKKLQNLDRIANNQRQKIDMMDENLMSSVPSFGEDAPAYNVPSRQELAKSSQEMAAAGMSPQDIYTAQQQKVQRGLEQYKSERQGWEDKVREFSLARGLEDEQLNFISGPDQQSGRVGRWLEDNKIENSQFWHDQGYRAFQDERKKHPGYTDQKLWELAKPKLDNIKNLEARGRQSAAKPWIFPGQGQKAKSSFQNSKKFVNAYYEMAGKTPETTERLKTMLADNGWDEDYVLTLSQPPSKGLENWFNKVNKLPPSSAAMSQGQGVDIRQKQQRGFDTVMESVNELVGEKKGDRGQLLGENDSVLLLRNRLVREKNLNQFQANEVIREIDKIGFLSHAQQSEIPQLEQDVKLYPMYQIFTDEVEE